MIAVSLNKVGKRFSREWVFRNVTAELAPQSRTVILGGNGSGKSTLLQIIAGFVTASEGSVDYAINQKSVGNDAVYKKISLSSPYLELDEELSGKEIVEHVGKFKPFLNQMKASQVLEIAELQHASDKHVRHYSSGMKQRLKLALAILADVPLLLLDEPSSNLDRSAIEWYQQMIEKYCRQKTIVVCSNAIEHEYSFCTTQLSIQQFKKVAY